MQNMWTDNSSTAYSSAEAVKQERIFMIYCCYISKGYKVNNVITFSCPCLWAATNCIWQWPSLPPSLDWDTLSWQSPHFQRLKTLFQILKLPLALETFTFKGRSLSAILNFLLKVRQIATDDLHFIISWWQWRWLCQIYSPAVLIYATQNPTRTRPGTRTFNHYPTRTRPEVKKCYPSGPGKEQFFKHVKTFGKYPQ